MTRQKVRMRNDMEFPPIDEFAYKVAEKALDEITYDEKTIREWINILAKQQPCDDAISRQAVLDKFAEVSNISKRPYHDMWEYVKKMPPVIPNRSTGKWIMHPKGGYAYLVCSNCLSYAPLDCKTNYCPGCGANMEDEE